MNSVGDIKMNIKSVIEMTEGMLESFDSSNPHQANTFMVKLWEMIILIQFRAAKKDGYEALPPMDLQSETFKNKINCYALMINLMKVLGH